MNALEGILKDGKQKARFNMEVVTLAIAALSEVVVVKGRSVGGQTAQLKE